IFCTVTWRFACQARYVPALRTEPTECRIGRGVHFASVLLPRANQYAADTNPPNRFPLLQKLSPERNAHFLAVLCIAFPPYALYSMLSKAEMSSPFPPYTRQYNDCRENNFIALCFTCN